MDVSVTSACRHLEAIVRDRGRTQNHLAHARALVAIAKSCGTNEIMRRSGLSKPGGVALAEAIMREGGDRPLRDMRCSG